MDPGTKVEVRDRFARTWRRGFEVAEAVDGGYRIRRMSDRSILPVVFAPDEVRREKKNDMWWF